MEVARDHLKSIVQRVERLESEIADLNADKSEIYKEARANGFDVKAIKKVVSKRKLDADEREEQDYVFETYWDAVHGTNLVHTHARENIEEFDPISGEIVSNMQDAESDKSRLAVFAVSGGEPSTPSSDDGGVKMDGGLTLDPGRSDVTSAFHNAKSEQATNTSSETVPRKTAADFRPHCLRPDNCGASGLTHCYSCSKQSAQRESEDA